MAWKQIKQPNLEHKDLPGWCLRFVQAAFGGPHKYPFAWVQWQASKQHTDQLPNVAVPVYFSWQGTIDDVNRNWGDVAIYVPGRGVFGTPLRGQPKGNKWHASVEERARAIGGGAKYVGWSEDLAGQAVVQWVADPVPVNPPTPGPMQQANYIRVLGDYRTLYHNPGSGAFNRIKPNNYPELGRKLDYQILDRAGQYVKIKTQMYGEAWIYVGPDVAHLTEYFNA